VALPLKVNDNEIMAVLTNKSDSNEICFPLEKMSDIKDKNELVYIKGIIFFKKI